MYPHRSPHPPPPPAPQRRRIRYHATAPTPLWLLLSALALFTAVSCGDGPVDECLAGEPRPIFEPTDSTVVAHDFTASGQRSAETVAFGNGLFLAVEQTGCDTLVQDFTLSHDSLAVDYAAFVPEGAQAFYQLASLAPRLEPFAAYARFLTSVPVSGPEGAPVDLAPGLTVRISGLPTPDRPSWRIRFSQDLSAARGPR